MEFAMRRLLTIFILSASFLALAFTTLPKPICPECFPRHRQARRIATPTPLLLLGKPCGPAIWWDAPISYGNYMSLVVSHDGNGYAYCPPPGSDWEKLFSTPGYYLTQTPEPSATFAPPPETPTPNPYPYP